MRGLHFFLTGILFLALTSTTIFARDCNLNGVVDEDDVALGTSADCNGNEIPDECDIAPLYLGFVRTMSFEFGASALLSEDTDLDGDLDLVAADSRTDTILLLANDGHGRFHQSAAFPLPSSARHIECAHFDNDGRADFAAALLFDLFILWGDRKETFGESQSIPVGSAPFRVRSGDVDGDGDLDLVTLNDLGNISVFANDSPGRFVHLHNTRGRPQPVSLRMTDFDKDGLVDLLVVARGPNEVVALRNAGGGSFVEVMSTPTKQEWASLSPLPAGSADTEHFVAADHGGSVHVLRFGGSGPFRETTELVTSMGRLTVALAGDVNGDGRVELVAAGRSGIRIFVNDDEGFVPQPTQSTPNIPATAILADFTGNGALELVSSRSRGIDLYTASVVTGVPDVDENRIPDSCDPDCNGNGVPDGGDIADGQSQDCDGNGVPDECEPDCDRNGRNDSYDIAESPASDCNDNGVPDGCELIHGDCNQNGELDECEIVRGDTRDCDVSGIPDVCEARANLSFGGQDLIPAAGTRPVDSADVDADGAFDVLVSDDGGLKIAWGERTGTTWRATLVHTISSLRGRFVVADFNADGLEDIGVSSAPGTNRPNERSSVSVRILFQGPPRRFVFGNKFKSESSLLTGLAAGFLDGDAFVDIVLADDHRVRLLRGDGNGVFSRPVVVANQGGTVDVSDFDGDGNVDIVVGSLQTGSGVMLQNDGNAEFVPTKMFGGGYRVVLADFDRDGDTDMITGWGGIYVNHGNAEFEGVQVLGLLSRLGGFPESWEVTSTETGTSTCASKSRTGENSRVAKWISLRMTGMVRSRSLASSSSLPVPAHL